MYEAANFSRFFPVLAVILIPAIPIVKWYLLMVLICISLVMNGNPMDGGAWWAAVHGVAGSWT